MTCESECSDPAATDNNGSDSEEKWDGSQKSKVMTPLKSALRKYGTEKKRRRVTFSASTVVYSDDIPEGTLEPMKGLEMCLTFEPPPEYQDYEPVTEFRDTDSESDWFPVISVNQQCSCENSSDDDSDDWDVLQCNDDDDVCPILNVDDVNLEEEEEEARDSENSDSSQDTIILLSQETESNESNEPKWDDVEQENIIHSPEPLEDQCEQDVDEDESEEEEWEEDSNTSDTIVDEDECVEDNSVCTEQLALQDEEEILKELSEEQDLDGKDEEDDYVYSKTSDIRRTIEQSATRRSLLRGTEARKRQSPNDALRRNSSSDCLSEKLRWLACPETLWDNEVTVPQDVREWKIETSSRSDELEQFVEQYITRIERIRKRYSLTDLGFVRNPSVRGIKPRFGSTTEILQQLQSQLRPHPLVNSRPHLTWPSHRNSYCGDETSSCSLKEERGVPEGASSSPVVSSDSLHTNCESSSEGVIYYSLNV